MEGPPAAKKPQQIPGAEAVTSVKKPKVIKRNSRLSAPQKPQADTIKPMHLQLPKKASKRIAAVKKVKKAGAEKKLKISSHPEGPENLSIPSTVCNASSSQFSGISFPQPSTFPNSSFTFDQIANELLSSISVPNLFASGAGNEVTVQSSTSPSVSVQQAQCGIQPRQYVESFSNMSTVVDSLNLTSQNSSYFELDLSQFLMLFSTIFEACLAPRLIFSDFPFSSTRLFMYKQLLFNDILGSIQKLLFTPSCNGILPGNNNNNNSWPACFSVDQLYKIFSISAHKLGVNLT